MKDQEAGVILFGLLGVKLPFEGIPILGNINWCYKMNKIINNFLIGRYKLMPEKPLTKNKERIQQLKVTGDTRYIYQLDSGCFPHDTANGDFKDLHRRIASGKVLW